MGPPNDELVDRFGRPDPSTVVAAVVRGAGWTGKTTFLGRIDHIATHAGHRVVRAAGNPGTRSLPYAGLAPLLTDPEALASRRGWEALAAARAGLDGVRVLIIDDAQWLDDASVELLTALAADIPAHRTSLVVAQRPCVEPSVRAFSAALARVGTVVELAPLDVEPNDPWIVAELERLGAVAARLLAVLACAGPVDDAAAAAVIGIEGTAMHDARVELRAAGLVDAVTDAVFPAVRRVQHAQTPAVDSARIHLALATFARQRGTPPAFLAHYYAAAGVGGADAAEAFGAAGRHSVERDPARALVWFDRAIAAGADPGALAAARAEAAARAGQVRDALAFADAAIGERERAWGAVALASARLGRWVRSAELYVRAGQPASAALARAVHGDRDDAVSLLAPIDGPATAVTLTAEGLIAAVDGEHTCARALLEEAVELSHGEATPLAAADVLAAVALHTGDLTTAQRAAQGRALLDGWVAVRAGRWDDADAVLATSARGDEWSSRDELLATALDVALARRANDAERLRAAWKRAESVAVVAPIDFLVLDAAGELVIGAARVGASTDASELASRIDALLERAGRPVVFSAWPAWRDLEIAVVAHNREAAEVATRRLRAAAAVAPRIRVLADAASCWVEILSSRVDGETVSSSARMLRSAGFSWEAARLAGGAAVTADDAAVSQPLLVLARELHRELQDRTAGRSARLTRRESEIGRLLLEGCTHREIGARLFLAPKTIEHQVAAIRNKLGVSTRSDMLAALRTELA